MVLKNQKRPGLRVAPLFLRSRRKKRRMFGNEQRKGERKGIRKEGDPRGRKPQRETIGKPFQ